MIFIGDIALPPGVDPFPLRKPWAASSAVVANLEGAIVARGEISTKEKKVFNDVAVLDYLEHLGVKIVSLANNHICDAALDPGKTVSSLRERGILACGAGGDYEEAEQTVVLIERDRQFVFQSFGWEAVRCRVAGRNRPGINRLTSSRVLSGITKAKKQYPEAFLVLLFHWDYELELYPMPMHRRLAFDAIDAGANAIVGTHPHCVQGIEVYKGAPIAYSVGNWFFPHNVFIDGRVRFPAYALRELAFEWNPERVEMICHWFQFDERLNTLNFIKSEEVGNSQWISELTTFRGMDHDDYLQFFKEHRVKRFFLPVYKDYEKYYSNWVKDLWIRGRHCLVNGLASMQCKDFIKNFVHDFSPRQDKTKSQDKTKRQNKNEPAS